MIRKEREGKKKGELISGIRRKQKEGRNERGNRIIRGRKRIKRSERETR